MNFIHLSRRESRVTRMAPIQQTDEGHWYEWSSGLVQIGYVDQVAHDAQALDEAADDVGLA